MEALLKQWMWVAKALCVVIAAYLMAKITNVYVGKALELKRSIGMVSPATLEPKAEETRRQSDFDIIVSRNIFDSSEAPPNPDDKNAAGGGGTAVPTGEAVKTSLPVKVLGIMMIGDGKDKRSSTNIESGGKTDAYGVGEEMAIASNAKLVQIKPSRIEFVNGGRLEYAELDMGMGENIFGPPKTTVASIATGEKAAPAAKEGGVAKLGETKFAVDQKEIDNAMANPELLFTEIRAVPNFDNGKVSGMKVLSVKPGSIFSKLGIKRGDVLQQINGMDLDVKQGFQMFQQLKDMKNFNMNIQRDGAKTTLEYEIR